MGNCHIQSFIVLVGSPLCFPFSHECKIYIYIFIWFSPWFFSKWTNQTWNISFKLPKKTCEIWDSNWTPGYSKFLSTFPAAFYLLNYKGVKISQGHKQAGEDTARPRNWFPDLSTGTLINTPMFPTMFKKAIGILIISYLYFIIPL